MAEKTEKKAHALSQERIRIKLRSYDHRMLDTSVSRIVETAQKRVPSWRVLFCCRFGLKSTPYFALLIPTRKAENSLKCVFTKDLLT